MSSPFSLFTLYSLKVYLSLHSFVRTTVSFARSLFFSTHTRWTILRLVRWMYNITRTAVRDRLMFLLISNQLNSSFDDDGQNRHSALAVRVCHARCFREIIRVRLTIGWLLVHPASLFKIVLKDTLFTIYNLRDASSRQNVPTNVRSTAGLTLLAFEFLESV